MDGPSSPEPSRHTPEIGPRLRQLRKRARKTLREVAEASDISESFLSQVERGRASISIAALQRVCRSLNSRMGDLFVSDTEQPYLVKRGAGIEVHLSELGIKTLVSPRAFTQFEAYMAVIPAAGTSGDSPYSHGDSEELVVVLAGELTATVESKRYLLSVGDTLSYYSSSEHHFVNLTDADVEVMWVISPPSY